MSRLLFFALQVDCESTQHAVRNLALGERALRGLGEVLAETDTKGTFLAIPGDLEAHTAIYRELETQGHEVGLHVHAAEQGHGEFLGDQSAEIQREVIGEAMDRFEQALGRRPLCFCPGYCSANDFTFGVIEELRLTHGTVSFPTRNLPQCACVWGSSPLDPHYPHRFNRMLTGDVNFVDLPLTIDPESRMWGGAHPQDLRVELVDAKNHWYTIDKAIRRQLREQTPLAQLHGLTHTVFDYSDPKNFRRETYVGIVEAARQIAEREKLTFQAATLGEVAAAYRKAVPLEKARPAKLELDTRGRTASRS